MAHEHRTDRRSLQIALVITTMFLLVELVGGLVAGSLALVSDAGHMFSDVLAFILSLGAITLATRLPTKQQTYGFGRAEVFAAFANSLLLIAVSAGILWEAYQRVLNPAPIQGFLMGTVAAAGLVSNVAVAYLLHGSQNVNVRSSFLHVIGDAVSSAAVIVAAVWIALTGETIIDPILSGLISIIIVVSAARIIRETLVTLLQFTPRDVDFDAVVADMKAVEGVSGVHHVHLWSLSSNINVLDAHVYSCERDTLKIEELKRKIKTRLLNYHILHSTLEFECEECKDCTLVEVVGRNP